MKKKAIILFTASALALSTVAYANWGQGGPGRGYGMGMQQPCMMQMQQLDEATRAKVDQFFLDNKELHKAMMVKRSEKRALMSGDNPDPKEAARLAGELFDLHSQLQEKAKAAGVEQYVGPMGRGMGGFGHGKGGGRHRGGNMM